MFKVGEDKFQNRRKRTSNSGKKEMDGRNYTTQGLKCNVEKVEDWSKNEQMEFRKNALFEMQCGKGRRPVEERVDGISKEGFVFHRTNAPRSRWAKIRFKTEESIGAAQAIAEKKKWMVVIIPLKGGEALVQPFVTPENFKLHPVAKFNEAC
ncbi:hypothetical protein Tco_0867247 [Tanacetum coccineum]